ncbi:hypothetical protein PIIN_11592 [Serendipita indica DSM 11827]|uniref:Uncharacterized protein n=1 Tax=Serendipita indica (strain DSM 11827) TaxID=1109443 RepID=G4U222_SERID|nr:hypothetical protein PIIN_11592 [Serendipita indica DSM 11827]
MSGFTTYTVLENHSPPESDKNYILTLRNIFGGTWDEVEFQDIVDSASKASFIDVSMDGLFYTVHPLLQIYIKDSLGEAANEHYCRVTAQLVLGAIRPPDGSNAELWQLIAHANSIPRSAQSEDVAHALAFCALYDSLGNWTACRELLESALTLLQRTQDSDNEDWVQIMGIFGRVLAQCGQLDAAEKIQRDVLAQQFEISDENIPKPSLQRTILLLLCLIVVSWTKQKGYYETCSLCGWRSLGYRILTPSWQETTSHQSCLIEVNWMRPKRCSETCSLCSSRSADHGTTRP